MTWHVGMSALCRHAPRCANIWEEVDGEPSDITFPCSGLSVTDAAKIVAAVNAASSFAPDILAALEVEWRRVAELAGSAARAQGGGGS